MQNEDRILHGVVTEKKKADEAFNAARKDGQTAGRVSEAAPTPGRAMKNFVVYMNVAAMSEATFKLSYQELVKKVLGKYTQKIHIEPNQIVDNITVIASYHEPQGIEMFSYALPDSRVFSSSSIDSQSTVVHASESIRELVYTPSTVTQQDFGDAGNGLKGDITLRYTLTPPVTNGGTIIVNDGAFVHYFSPSGLSTLSKTIVFVIDVSGSMSGDKIKQVKVAMHSILIRLRENDSFNIIVFNADVHRWQPGPVMVTSERISAAKSYVDRMKAEGGTNINDALISGVYNINNALRNRGNLVVFLTDGVQTAGEQRPDVILENVQGANHDGLVSIFSLGFGVGVNFEFLRKISLRNYGTAYKIYEDKDASKQLGDFFREIESVTLRDVKFQYPVEIVVKEDLTETSFSNFFNGSEIVVAGNLQPEVDLLTNPLTASILAVGANRDVIFSSTAELESTGETQQFTQRLWAYKKIKEYLDRALISNEEDRERYEQKALTLSLRYSFVTRLTSMVVTEAVNAGNTGFGQLNRVGLSAMKANYGSNNYGTNKGTCASLTTTCAVVMFLVHFVRLHLC
ncbi:inter-alpha-trypsin inhibitor heavy chain H4-like [Mizuhopecten yessoensis]|uniref:Inter-alpha-trypsin inhibitor heavy chain H4 n=1 Tax=Mizuhopecten yessoensis TaxID=6573 RepID=A0A210QSY2_MIZYE|nr:inter-alpha-trypsin inhibitor heavy chain H4-like [Mizuhopecten yessoensis]OWF51846.1 Inter-alpha-trypsin inhibitor heavy chain H4 [Mizuhopecten yessoensis]